jgi:HAD superfamily hydrolase (TIGR01509 family)
LGQRAALDDAVNRALSVLANDNFPCRSSQKFGGSSRGNVKFEAVLFDVGNTLLSVPFDPHQRAVAAASHLGRIPFEPYKSSLNQAREEWWEAIGDHAIQDLAETWIAHNHRALELIGFQGDIALAARLIEESFLLEGWEIYSEAIAVLGHLSTQGIRMGVISNWPPTLKRALEAAGLRRYFEVIVVSGVEGYAKPHPRIFELALDRLQVDPEATLYVGDNVVDDVQGADSVGMPSVLIDRDGSIPDHPNRIASLDELVSHKKTRSC